ncbi:hypothetical protein [Kitasatospora sp. GAS1066B]|uniref:hypothetical protein n=1 Tax=Kitasatospora sp. GAS1066B TaxID=3156271 RepID=UPI003518D8DE
MGIYLVSVGAAEWFDVVGDGYGELAAALNVELRRRGLPPYETVPESMPEGAEFVPGSGQSFEEKLSPGMDGFGELCRRHLSQAEAELLSCWTVLVPCSIEGEIRLPVESAYFDETIVLGAPQLLAVAEKLASAVELPPEVPAMCDNLELSIWFMDGSAKELAAARPGRWSEDLDAAFYVALYLRAAQHSLRRGCPLVFG